MSIVVDPKSDIPQQLTFLAAVAVQKALLNVSKLRSSIKWPNDLLVGKRKICGILTENIFQGKSQKMIVGIGINVNNKIPDELKDKAITLYEATSKKYTIKKIVNRILFEFEKLYKIYTKKGFSLILNEWKKSNGTLGRKVKIKCQTKTYIGKAFTVDEECNLYIKNSKGKKKKIIEGDLFFV